LIADDGRFLDVAESSGGRLPADPMEVIARLAELAEEAPQIPPDAPRLNGRRLGPPVPRPQKILGAGINYRSHAVEANFDVPSEPALFAKLPSAITGPADEIVIPPGRRQIDWEAEVVVVIGRRCKSVREGEAWDCVAGITAGQDISDREEQFRDLRQFTIGKSFDTYAPIGPVVATPDELDDPDDIEVICRLNGEEMQRGRTRDCIFSVPELVAWLSRVCTLEPGDLIFTGTPLGVGYIRTPPRFLSVGDILETEVSGVGGMRNTCASAVAGR
jgi:2-keto-4-pentenoate hydratase/2-oxohepta-3-ene-1,7-dioic acid hydratase in catechol pathway